MDHTAYGVKATVIDLGLARMDAEGESKRTRWTAFEPEVFEGEGTLLYVGVVGEGGDGGAGKAAERPVRLRKGVSW